MVALTAIEIKTELMQRGISITELARRWRTEREIVSRVVNRHGGYAYPQVRKKLARYLGVSISEIGRETARPKKKAA